MKTLLHLVLFSLLSCNSHSQGVTAQYLYWSGGSYWFSFANTGSCDADVRMHYTKGGLPVDTTVLVSQQTTSIIQLPAAFGSATDIKFKSDGQCSTTGWVTVSIGGQILPIYIKSFQVSRLFGQIKLNYTLAWDISPTDVVELQRSMDGKSFATIHVIALSEHSFVDKGSGTQYYRIKISDNLSFHYSNVVVVGPWNENDVNIVLYTIDGRYVGTIPRRGMLPRGLFIANAGGRVKIISVNQN